MTQEKSLDADVIVVGSGGAGLAAAIDAMEHGASVLVVEREEEMGGATAISGGGCFIVATPLQAEKGIVDTTEKALEEWLRWGQGSADEEWARFYIEKGCDALFHWMAGLGVDWDALNHHEGNSVPRWHHPQGGGKGLWQALYGASQKLGVARWLTNTAATELTWEGNAISGLRVRRQDTGEDEELRCKTVVMATGGFMSNVEMIRGYRPDLRSLKLMAGSHVGATGDGHRMVEGAGGTLTHMDHLWMYAYATPDYRDPEEQRGLVVRGLPDYVWVNAQGQRFHNETLSGGASATPAVLAQSPQYCWAVIDDAMRSGADISDPYYRDGAAKHVERIESLFQDSPYIKSADTLQGLAAESGLPPEEFERSVQRYNSYIDEGLETDPEFGRPLTGRKKVQQAPFFALQFFPLSRKSFGGVKTDLRCRVLDQDGQPISGLYAAGELTGMAGGHINGHAGLEGTMLGPSLFSGRVAGAWAANGAGFGEGFSP
jgi:flavocytochrome c